MLEDRNLEVESAAREDSDPLATRHPLESPSLLPDEVAIVAGATASVVEETEVVDESSARVLRSDQEGCEACLEEEAQPAERDRRERLASDTHAVRELPDSERPITP